MNNIEFSADIKDKSKKFEQVIKACNFILNNHSIAISAKEYIDKRISANSISKFEIGYFPPSLDLNVLFEHIDIQILRDLNLLYSYNALDRGSLNISQKLHFEHHNIIIPLKDEYGNIVALIGRSVLNDDERKELNIISKYKYTQFNKSMFLFGLFNARNAIRNCNKVVIVEGQIDCINCHSNGFFNTVAVGGSSLSWYQVMLLKRYTNNIVLAFDNDDAGRKGERRIIKKFGSLVDIDTISIPEKYKDIDEYLVNSENLDVLARI